MYLRDSGKGDAVLLLHGTPGPASVFASVAEKLAGECRVLLPDLPGYGRSPALADSSIENVGDALAAILRDLGIDRLRAIVGFSTGAYRAFDLVLRHQIPTKLIVSIGGVAHFDNLRATLRVELADLLAADPTLIASDAVRGLLRDVMLSPRWREEHPDDEARVLDWLKMTTGPALAAELRALSASRDLRPELSRVEAFVYARAGDGDEGAPAELSREIIEAVPRGELELVAGCGHALLIEDQLATTDAIVSRVRALG